MRKAYLTLFRKADIINALHVVLIALYSNGTHREKPISLESHPIQGARAIGSG